MATTDTKPGFRLPWSSEHSEPGDAGEVSTEAAQETTIVDGESVVDASAEQEIETHAMIDAAPAAPPTHETAVAPALAASAAARKPNKFMADLSKAMQAAAESARTDALERLAADAKAHIESMHADSATEATDLRKRADDDVATVREWSKSEIARIRDEAEERITHRKGRLEREIDEHAAAIQARIERVQGRVAGYESEMATFFERLLAEDDPTHFAAMAESLPEPPPFETDEPAADPVTRAAVQPTTHAPIASAVEPAPSSGGAGWPGEGSADLFSATEPASDHLDDPRLSMLALTPDFAAAEAEAATFSPDDATQDEAPSEIADETIAARLAGLVPDGGVSVDAHASTRLVVVGLVSVASIAGFKRHLARHGGIHTVGVSSGPDGEFIFTVSHDASVALRDVVPTLPGFAARVTGDADGVLTVTARDPESEN